MAYKITPLQKKIFDNFKLSPSDREYLEDSLSRAYDIGYWDGRLDGAKLAIEAIKKS